jgi:calnexin
MLFFHLLSAVVLAEELVELEYEYKKTMIVAPFLDQFESLTWTISNAKKFSEKNDDDNDELLYRGVWEVEDPLLPLIAGDKGLVLKTLAAHSVRLWFM